MLLLLNCILSLRKLQKNCDYDFCNKQSKTTEMTVFTTISALTKSSCLFLLHRLYKCIIFVCFCKYFQYFLWYRTVAAHSIYSICFNLSRSESIWNAGVCVCVSLMSDISMSEISVHGSESLFELVITLHFAVERL